LRYVGALHFVQGDTSGTKAKTKAKTIATTTATTRARAVARQGKERVWSGAGEGVANLVEESGEVGRSRGGATEAGMFVGGSETQDNLAE
jgi:hypothetical protein